MRPLLFALLLAVSAQASAQSGVLVARLPDGVTDAQVLEMAREVLIARGWSVDSRDRTTLHATRERSAMHVFIDEKGLRFSDRSVRPRGTKQREHRDEGPQLTAVPQAELDALRSDLAAALDGKLPVAGARLSPPPPGQVLLDVPASADPERVMRAARNAFAGRKWAVSGDADGALVARIRGVDTDSTLKVFLADGTLWFVDDSVDRNGGKVQVPERWLNFIRSDLRASLSQLGREQRRPPPARESAAGNQDPAERLRRLKGLLDGGLITPAEYEAKRAEILKGL